MTTAVVGPLSQPSLNQRLAGRQSNSGTQRPAIKQSAAKKDPFLPVLALFIISWLPAAGFQIVAVQLAVPTVLFFFWLRGSIGFLPARLAILAYVFLSVALVAVLRLETGYLNAAAGLINYSPFLLFAINFKSLEQKTLDRLFRVVVWVTIIEGILGIYQYAVSDPSRGGLTGSDAVVGTLSLFTLTPKSHHFTIKMLSQGAWLGFALFAPERPAGEASAFGKKVPKSLLVVGVITAFVSSALASHVAGWVLFGASVLAASLFSWNPKRVIPPLIIGGGLLFASYQIIVRYFDPSVAMRVEQFASATVSDDPREQGTYGLKTAMLRESIGKVLLASPENALLGIGLGSYSSSAALLLSGGWGGTGSGRLPVSRSKETDDFLFPLMSGYANVLGYRSTIGSSSAFPTSSFQSVLIEFGLVSTTVLAVSVFSWGISAFARYRRWKGAAGLQHDAFSRATFVTAIFVFAVGLTHTFWEYASTTVPLFLFLALMSSCTTKSEALGIDNATPFVSRDAGTRRRGSFVGFAS